MISKLEHRFVDSIPEELEPGILYVSLRFRVVMHSCCCGCKGKVITPLSPARWKMTFDGKTISLDPSIGNWNSDCQSHYWITNSEVEWAGRWSKERIALGKINEKERRAKYYSKENLVPEQINQLPKQKQSLVSRIIKKLFS